VRKTFGVERRLSYKSFPYTTSLSIPRYPANISFFSTPFLTTTRCSNTYTSLLTDSIPTAASSSGLGMADRRGALCGKRGLGLCSDTCVAHLKVDMCKTGGSPLDSDLPQTLRTQLAGNFTALNAYFTSLLTDGQCYSNRDCAATANTPYCDISAATTFKTGCDPATGASLQSNVVGACASLCDLLIPSFTANNKANMICECTPLGRTKKKEKKKRGTVLSERKVQGPHPTGPLLRQASKSSFLLYSFSLWNLQ
jgi:hypothetical protein